jgi:prepilin-type processing-associated H-X9-DG protein
MVVGGSWQRTHMNVAKRKFQRNAMFMEPPANHFIKFRRSGMKTTRHTQMDSVGETHAFTVLELLVAIATGFLLAALILPALYPPRHTGAARIRCTNNLKQIGISFRLWSGDNGDRFPMQYYTNASGGMQFADATNGFRYFQVMSNELIVTKMLICDSDPERTSATNFALDLSNSNISYFIGLDADGTRPSMLLAGDGNLKTSAPLKNGILTLNSNTPVDWTKAMHRNNGNILFADGSVRPMSNAGLRNAMAASGTNVIRLLMP